MYPLLHEGFLYRGIASQTHEMLESSRYLSYGLTEVLMASLCFLILRKHVCKPQNSSVAWPDSLGIQEKFRSQSLCF